MVLYPKYKNGILFVQVYDAYLEKKREKKKIGNQIEAQQKES
jgi:hypothetical protein